MITRKQTNGKTCPVYFFYSGKAGTTSEVRNNFIYTYGGIKTTNTYTVLLDTWSGTFNLFNSQLPVITTNNNDTSGVYGISGLNAQTDATCNIYNNFIGGNLSITGTGIPSVATLMYLQDSGTYNVYYNSFNYPSVSNNTERSCIHISGSSVSVTLVNNIIVNNTDAPNAYCIWKSKGLLISDYTDLYVLGGMLMLDM